MDKKHLDTLEFPQILHRLARHTSFSAGRDLVLALQPSPIVAQVRQRLQETREARHLLDAHGGMPLGGAHDVRPLVRNASRGAVLQPTDLLDIAGTLRVGTRVQRLLGRLKGQLPLLADIAARIEPCQALAEEIGRCISEQGEVNDHASAKLARLRRELRIAHERLQDRLNRILANPRNAPYLQESLITQRGGRYVIPIKADFKGRIPGIVHDSSASGATLFIEPLSAVETTNRWRELQIEERKEVERILAELSGLVAELADELSWTVEALAELDLILAKAHYANELVATEPRVVAFTSGGRRPGTGPKRRSENDGAPLGHPGSVLDLRQARHPLLDPETVVPIDVHLGDDYFVLVITGPNTGGKTVSLKTVGLMSVMAQSGLHLPVGDGSAISVFDGIYADIGDEQSIEQSLSTFSSHLTNIIRLLDHAGERSMVLLDELGAGTDPVEGSALARAILSYLLERRITTLVATHYSELKAYAHTTPGVENASVEFDLETLSPTYRMQIGLPGRSNAFAIAERLGLSSQIVDLARGLVSPDELKTESLLGEIQQAHREATAARDDVLLGQRRMAEQERQLNARLAAIEAERASILGEARAEARRELSAVREEIDALRSEISDSDSPSQAALGEAWLAQAQARLTAQEELVRSAPPPLQPDPMVLSGEVQVGDTVWIRGLNTTGQVISLEGDSAEVRVGSFGVRVQCSELERRVQLETVPLESARVSAGVLSGSQFAPSIELDLRGQRVEEALPRVDKYLDDAFLAGMPLVRIVHGKGTGVLRQAVREQLHAHPLVKSHRSGERGEGGSGVTVVYLLES